MILTLYSTGMRVSELTHLKVVDIDNKRMLIRIDQGKNKKDRYVKLSEKLLVILRQYWSAEKCKPSTWLFPGYGTDTPLGRNSVALMMRKARAKSGIRKPVTAHTLRHTYATHMLDDGEDIRKIQLFLGHRSIRTTAMYLQVTLRDLREAKNPLDTLDLD